MKSLCDIKIQLEGGNSISRTLGTVLKGELIITPHCDIPVSRLGYDFIGEVRGKIENKTSGLLNRYLLQNSILKANETYRYPILFLNTKYETYTGINVNTLIKLEVYILVDRMRALKMKGPIRDFYGKFNWGKEKKIEEELYIHFEGANNQYSIKTTDLKLNLTAQSYFKSIFKWVGLAFIAAFFSKKIALAIVSVFGIALLGLLIYYWIGKLSIGTIHVKLAKNDDSTFQYLLTNNKNWQNIKSLLVRYEIRERVEDNRGTTSAVYDNLLFKSPDKKVENLSEIITVSHDFQKGFPGTSKIADSDIYWQCVVTVKLSSGLSFACKNRFVVGKI